MSSQVSQINSSFRNSLPKITFQKYVDPYSKTLRVQALEIFEDRELWAQDHLEDLQIVIKTALLHARATVMSENEAEQYWSQFTNEIENSLILNGGYLPKDVASKIELFASKLKSTAKESLQLRMASLNEYLSETKESLLVLEKTNLNRFAYNWLEESQNDVSVKMIPNMGQLSNSHLSNLPQIILLGSPNFFVARAGWEANLRMIFHGGLTPEVVFLSPSWASLPTVEQLQSRLFAGFDWAPKLSVEVKNVDNDEQSNTIIPLDELDEIDIQRNDDFSRVQRHRTGGHIKCKGLNIGVDLIYPIEFEAEKIRIFNLSSENGKSEVVNKNISELEIGDVVVALLDSSEQQALRLRAVEELKEQAKEILSSQSSWKQRLLSSAKSIGWEAVNQALASKGVRAIERAEYWAEENSLGPQSDLDFECLLSYLNFEKNECEKIIHNSRQLMQAFIRAGHATKSALEEIVEDQEISKLQSGRSVIVELEEFGDAKYLLAPLRDLNFTVIHVIHSQIRRTLKVNKS